MVKNLLDDSWVIRLNQFHRLIVGFSGGLDSTVLLHVLTTHPALSRRIVAIHINHGISPNATAWQVHCENVCNLFGVRFEACLIEFDQSANLEERARNARYRVFSDALSEMDCLLLGHHLNDQAETVLLQLFRGAGVDGLAAMPELIAFGVGILARPLLHLSREQLKDYALANQLTWIEDESNTDLKYSRNFLRQQIIPMLQSKWPGVVRNIARTATHCQQARTSLDELAIRDCPSLTEPLTVLPIKPLMSLSFDRINNVLRVWLRKNQVKLPSTATLRRLIDEVILSRHDAMPKVSWGNVLIQRYQGHLYLDNQDAAHRVTRLDWNDFPNELNLSSNLSQPCLLSARHSKQGVLIPNGALIQVKFRQGGELFSWHGQTKQLKKLFQDWQVPPWRRDRIPLVYINHQLAAVVGYAISDTFYTNDSPMAWEFVIGF